MKKVGKIDSRNFGLIVFFRYLKTLAAGIKTKTYGTGHGHSGFKWRVASADYNNIKRIMVFGDSNACRPGSYKKSWPKLLEDKDPLRLNVFNESSDGRTTICDRGECNGLGVINKKLADHAPLDYVVVMLGTNDVKNKYGPPCPSEIVEGMSRILDIIENNGNGAKPILLTPPPLGNSISGELEGAKLRIPSVVDEYRRLSISRNVPLIDIYSILEIRTDLESDMIHLNAVGRRKVADTIWLNSNFY